MTDTTELAEIGYDAYRDATGGLSAITGEPLPDFKDTPPSVRQAWRAAAGAIDRAVTEEIAGYKEDPLRLLNDIDPEPPA